MTKELRMLYQASVIHPGELISIAKDETNRASAKFKLETREVEFPILPHLFRRLSEKPVSGPCQLLIYPRADREGQLARGTCVAEIYPEAHHPNGLVVLGELTRVDRELGLVLISLHPNRGGSLKQSFRIWLNVSLELLESFPPLRHGVIVQGTLREKSLRLMATSVREVPLPPKRQAPPPPKPKVEPKPQPKQQPKSKPKPKKPQPYKPDQVVRAKRKWG